MAAFYAAYRDDGWGRAAHDPAMMVALFVYAAWHHRQPPRISEPLRRRQAGADPAIVALSWKTQRRLHRVWSRMEQRGKRRTIIAVAAARELAGFCWAVATE